RQEVDHGYQKPTPTSKRRWMQVYVVLRRDGPQHTPFEQQIENTLSFLQITAGSSRPYFAESKPDDHGWQRDDHARERASSTNVQQCCTRTNTLGHRDDRAHGAEQEHRYGQEVG